MTDQTTPAPADALRQRIAEALMRWAEGNNAPKYASIRRPETVTANAYGRADAVLAVVQPELDRLRKRIHEYRDSRHRWMESAYRDRHAALAAHAAIARVQDAAALHRKQLISTPELYAVIEAALDQPPPAHDGPSVAEAKADDRAHWDQKYAGEGE